MRPRAAARAMVAVAFESMAPAYCCIICGAPHTPGQDPTDYALTSPILHIMADLHQR